MMQAWSGLSLHSRLSKPIMEFWSLVTCEDPTTLLATTLTGQRQVTSGLGSAPRSAHLTRTGLSEE